MGRHSFNSMPDYIFSTRMNRRTHAFQNGCFRKMGNHLLLFTPNHHPPKKDFLPKHFCLYHPRCYMASAAFKFVLQPAATTYAFPSVCFFFYISHLGNCTWQSLFLPECFNRFFSDSLSKKVIIAEKLSEKKFFNFNIICCSLVGSSLTVL